MGAWLLSILSHKIEKFIFMTVSKPTVFSENHSTGIKTGRYSHLLTINHFRKRSSVGTSSKTEMKNRKTRVWEADSGSDSDEQSGYYRSDLSNRSSGISQHRRRDSAGYSISSF